MPAATGRCRKTEIGTQTVTLLFNDVMSDIAAGKTIRHLRQLFVAKWAFSVKERQAGSEMPAGPQRKKLAFLHQETGEGNLFRGV